MQEYMYLNLKSLKYLLLTLKTGWQNEQHIKHIVNTFGKPSVPDWAYHMALRPKPIHYGPCYECVRLQWNIILYAQKLWVRNKIWFHISFHRGVTAV